MFKRFLLKFVLLRRENICIGEAICDKNAIIIDVCEFKNVDW
jgi:hypothetical protein